MRKEWGASHFCNPHPKSLSQSERGTLNLASLLPSWEKGLGDEGKLAKLGCTQKMVFEASILGVAALTNPVGLL